MHYVNGDIILDADEARRFQHLLRHPNVEEIQRKLKEKTMNDINDLYDVIQSGLALAGLSIVDFDKDGMIVRDKIKDNDYRIKITEEVK